MELYHKEIMINITHGQWTLLTFSGANCSYVANCLVVTLGPNPKVQGNSELRFLENSKVFLEQSDISLTAPASGKVTLTPPDPKV
jgi:hypothetical protein